MYVYQKYYEAGSPFSKGGKGDFPLSLKIPQFYQDAFILVHCGINDRRLPVPDLGQIKAMGRGGGSGQISVAGFEDIFEFFIGNTALAHLDQRPHNGPDHVAQKTIGLQGEADQGVVFGFQVDSHHVSNRCFNRTAGGLESGEIVFTQ